MSTEFKPDEFQALRHGMSYPDVPMPEVRDWFALPEDYAPVEYIADLVKRHVSDWEHPDLDVVWNRAQQLTSSNVLLRDMVSGRPLNPAGPTGVSGYGRLRSLGPNLSADGIVTRGDNLPDTEVLLVTRSDTGQLAFPGGFLDNIEGATYEHPLQAAIREVWEETDVLIRGGRAHLLHRGIARVSLRNTDNAWIENTTYHLHLSAEHGSSLTPHAKDDAVGADWFRLRDVDLARMSDAHRANTHRLFARIQGDF